MTSAMSIPTSRSGFAGPEKWNSSGSYTGGGGGGGAEFETNTSGPDVEPILMGMSVP